jgi:hypothetical protein
MAAGPLLTALVSLLSGRQRGESSHLHASSLLE